MSISASIDIYLSERSSTSLSVPELLENFVIEGWNYVDCKGQVTILPFGDGEDFNWTTITFDRDNLFNVLRRKQEQQEIIGIELLRVDSEFGCGMLILNTNQLVLVYL